MEQEGGFTFRGSDGDHSNKISSEVKHRKSLETGNYLIKIKSLIKGQMLKSEL